MRHLRFSVLFLVGVLLTLGLAYYIGFEEIMRDLASISLGYFLVFLGIQVIMMLLWAFKWSIILRHTRASFRKILPVSFVGYLVNNIVPFSMVGGEPVRAYLLGRVDDISIEDSVACVIVDLFLEIFPLLGMILLAVVSALFYDLGTAVALILAAAGVFVLFILSVILLLFVNEKVSMKVIQTTINFVAKLPVSFLRDHAKDAQTRVDDIIKNFMKSMRVTMTDWKIIVVGTILSSLIWALWIIRMHFIFKMINYELPLSALIIGRIVVASAALFSVIPGGLGIWEGVGTWIYTVFGVPASSAMAANLIERLFSLWIGSLIGLAAAAYLGVTHYLEKYI